MFRRPLHRLAPIAVLAFVLASVLALSGLAQPIPTAAADGVNILPESSVQSNDIPYCGTYNLQYNDHWGVTSEIGSGSTVLVGTTWTITAVVFADAQLDLPGNDGPDPINLRLVPSGPVIAGAAPVGSIGGQNGSVSGGNGFTGPLGPLGTWGYSFDFDSDPDVLDLMGDGVDAVLTVTARATAPGVIELDNLVVDGWDSTPPQGAIGCSLGLGWSWTVIAGTPATATGEHTFTDARYDDTVTGDANEGHHTLSVNVLGNDKDQNGQGGLGDTSEVRLKSWTTVSVNGGTVNCGDAGVNGVTPTNANFTSLATGPCTYTPPVGFTGVDNFQYTIVQRSDLTLATAKAYINVLPNNRPLAGDHVFVVAQGADDVFSLADFLVDTDGDAKVCFPNGDASPNNVGTFTIGTNCTLDWDNTDGAFTGLVTVPFRVCDTHTLLDDPGLAPQASRADDYAALDLDQGSSRRCTMASVDLSIIAGAIIPPVGATDQASVDAYSDEAYTIVIPVLLNDSDPNGPTPTEVEVLTAPDPAEGTAIADGGTIKFTSVQGYPGGVVHFTYRLCEDPAQQNPSYNGLPYCGVGHIYVTVVGNQAPLAVDDELGSVDHTAHIVQADLNDFDPEGDALSCDDNGTPTPGAFDSVAVWSDCSVHFDPADDFNGVAEIPYLACDDHHLLNTQLADTPYGSQGAIPGDGDQRCSTAVVRMTIEEPGFEDQPENPTGAPLCVEDKVQVAWNSAHPISVLANDSDLDQQNQPSPLTLKAVDNPTTKGGTVEVQGDHLLYTPANAFVGWDETTYSAIDTDGQGCAAVVKILVIGDLDGDGIDNGHDPDVDGDGVPNDEDPDDDGDGIPDDQDPDDDGDGVADQMPGTGSDTAPMLWFGLALVAGGVILTPMGRRRRA